MRNVQILINGEVADFYQQDDLSPRVTKQLFNAENITQVAGDYAINILFPISEANTKIFSYIDILSTNKSFYDLRLLLTVITLDGDTLIEGNLQVNQITKKGFECTLISKAIDWIKEMKNNSLRDIPLREIYFSGNKSIQAPINWALSVQCLGSVAINSNILTITQRGDYTASIQYGIILDGDIISGPGIPVGTTIIKQLTPDPGTAPQLPIQQGEIWGGRGTYLLSQNATLTTSSTYAFQPYWWDFTEGHYDIFETPIIGDTGKDETSGEYDFAMPLISYGNFKYPYIEGYIIDNPFNSDFLLVVVYTSVALVVGDEISSLFPDIFVGLPPVIILTQDSGVAGYVGEYSIGNVVSQEYGNAENLIKFTTIKRQGNSTIFPIRDSAITEGYYYYNNIRQGLTNISLFPCPYVGKIISTMFSEYGKNTSGSFFNSLDYRNLIIPFTSSEDAPWNWGILSRLGVIYDHQPSFPLLDVDYNRQPFNNGANTFQVTRAGHQLQFCRINTSGVTNVATGNTGPTPATVTANEKYLYDQTFFDDFAILSSPSHETFKCVIDGEYRFSYYLKGFGAHTFTNPEDWNRQVPLGLNKPLVTNDRFFFIVVKRTDNLFTGSSGVPFIDYTGIPGQYVTSDGNPVFAEGIYIFPDAQVCYVQVYDVTTGNYDNLNTTNIDIDISLDVNVEAGETLEVIFVAGNATSTSTNITQPPGFSIRHTGGVTPNFSSMSCYPLTFPTLLSPSKFLPDIQQSDFLRSIMNTFNLFLFPDNATDTIHINDFANFFLPNSALEDWSDKCSVDDPAVVLSPLNTFKKVEFYEVTDTSDVHTKMLTQPVSIVTNDSSNFTDIKKIETMFSQTVVKPYKHSSAFGGYLFPDTRQYVDVETTVLNIPTMSDDAVYSASVFDLQIGNTEFSYDFNIRILKYLGLQYFVGGVETLVIPGPPPDLVYSGYTYIEDINLDTTPPLPQGDPFMLYKILPMATNISFDYPEIWGKWLDVVTNNTKVDIPVWLLSKDINTIDLRKPVKIGPDTYYINRIFQFSPIETRRTQVSLFKKK